MPELITSANNRPTVGSKTEKGGILVRLTSLLMTCLLIMPGGVSSAQENATISGYVKDAADGEALPYVNIAVPTLEVGTTTNEYGYYALRLPQGVHEITFSLIGYQSNKQTIALAQDYTFDIELSVSVIELLQVEVLAEEADQNVETTEMSTTVLKVKTVQQIPTVAGEVDLVQAVQLLPGVSTVREGASGFNVRGGAADQNLILLDEAIVYNAAHLFGFFSVFNADIAKDVKIYKGGIPARYGGRLSSVLDVRQKEGNTKRVSGQTGIGLLSGRMLLEGPLADGRGSYIVAGRRSYGDLIFRALSSNSSTAHFYDVNFKANYNLDANNRLFISGYRGRDALELEELLGDSWGNTTATIRWNRLFSGHLFANFTGVFSNYNYNSDTFIAGAGFNWQSHITNYKFKTDFTYTLNPGSSLDFGASNIFYRFTPGDIKPIGEFSSVVETQLDRQFAIEPSIYFSVDHRLHPLLSLQYGVRLSAFSRQGAQDIPSYLNDQPIVFNEILGRYEEGTITGFTSYGSRKNIKSYTGLEPRFAARWTLTESSSLKASYNRTRQYIHLISNTTTAQPLAIWRPSGPFLKPQTADQVAVGYFRNFLDNTYETSVETYYKKMDDLVDYIDGADLTVNDNLETELLKGRGRSYGTELMVRKNGKKLTGWLGYTWSRTERQIPGLGAGDLGINNGDYYPASNDKTHDLSLTTIYAFNPRWSLSTNFVLASGTPTTYPVSRYEFANFTIPQYEVRNGARLPMYHRLDLGLTYTVPSGNNWVFSIYNVYNRHNAASITVGQAEDDKFEAEAVQTSIFGIVPGITYNRKF